MRRLVLLLFLALPSHAFAQASAPVDASGAGGSQYAPVTLSVAPGTFVAGSRVVVNTRVGGRGVLHIGRAALPVRGTTTQSWTPRVAPGTYVAKLRVRHRTVGTFPVTVTAPIAPVAASSKGVFPIRGTYTFGDGAARFGAKRDGHVHQGQDVFASEGTPLVSPVTGTVVFRKVQPSGAGHYLVIRDAEGADYVFMHLVAGSELVSRGDRVRAGQGIGQVGQTGDAQGPHLHFELWPNGWFAPGSTPVDPLPLLRAWAA